MRVAETVRKACCHYFFLPPAFLETDKWKSVKVYILRLAQLFEKPKKSKRKKSSGSVKKNKKKKPLNIEQILEIVYHAKTHNVLSLSSAESRSTLLLFTFLRSVFRFKTSNTLIPLFDFEYNMMEFSIIHLTAHAG